MEKKNKNKEFEGFLKYKCALLLKGVYRKNSYRNEEQLHLNYTLKMKDLAM